MNSEIGRPSRMRRLFYHLFLRPASAARFFSWRFVWFVCFVVLLFVGAARLNVSEEDVTTKHTNHTKQHEKDSIDFLWNKCIWQRPVAGRTELHDLCPGSRSRDNHVAVDGRNTATSNLPSPFLRCQGQRLSEPDSTSILKI